MYEAFFDVLFLSFSLQNKGERLKRNKKFAHTLWLTSGDEVAIELMTLANAVMACQGQIYN